MCLEHSKVHHNKKYDGSTVEAFRKKIFLQNTHLIARHNVKHAKGEISYNLKMNQFGDMVSAKRTADTAARKTLCESSYLKLDRRRIVISALLGTSNVVPVAAIAASDHHTHLRYG